MRPAFLLSDGAKDTTMTGITAQRNLSRPARSKAETKAEITDRTARAIIDAEAARREAKTEKLRRARLAREERDAAASPAAEETKAKTSKARRTRSTSATNNALRDIGA